MKLNEQERISEALLKHCQQWAQRVQPEALVCKLLGHKPVLVTSPALNRECGLITVNGAPRIYVRASLPPVRRRWALAYELAKWWLTRASLKPEEASEAALGIAASLLIPRTSFFRAQSVVGEKSAPLAEHFGVSESCLVLRESELTERPLALVAPLTVRVRGAGFHWPEEKELRELAEKPRISGVKKARLKDDTRRVALWGTSAQAATRGRGAVQPVATTD
ncbi:MAG: ImmA/IrrE family metallo-endopeptidase [Polyangiaceae bacterium]|nr:ImmA/IrrE family metallo-endopeptidase [Polyangiaceae bacterium]